MSKVIFQNEYFLFEKAYDNKNIVTVLKDDRCFYGICLEGCKFITNRLGFIEYLFTDEVEKQIELYCNENSLNIDFFKNELRNKTINILIGMIA